MSQSKLAKFIIDQIKHKNVKSIFGVPGDYNLAFLDYFIHDSKLQWVGNCNELNAAYAADGYARIKGFGVLVTTYGVGELSAINGVAGSYAEHVPVLHIVGYPKTTVLNEKLPVHHSLANKDPECFLRSVRSFTCEAELIASDTAACQILKVIDRITETQLPGVIALPCDLLETMINTNTEKTQLSRDELPDITKFTKLFNQAKTPIILVGADVRRFSWQEEVLSLIESTNIPFVTTFMGKTVLPESHPNYMGLYAGDLSSDSVQNYIENSDCIISVGTQQTDFNTGGFSDQYSHLDNHIKIKWNYIEIQKDIYRDVDVKALLSLLTRHLKKSENPVEINFSPQKISHSSAWEQKNFWRYAAQKIIKDDDTVFAEAGTSLFGILPEYIPSNARLYSQILWSSIGYTLPAAFGASLANNGQRVILFIGDGSFQLTAQELCRIAYEKTNVMIIFINNDGYTVERAIHGPNEKYNDIPRWDYSSFAKSLGFENTEKIDNFIDLNHCIDKYDTINEPVFLECFFKKEDSPRLLLDVAEKIKSQNK
ncbi:MAG: indolepyruvate decarboxylase [Coxiellaceae bacterium]|nr:indolepyruvate decarboxylase [Coxiellaceae bacterium]|tara:strand:- start:2761 stop:4383 length:1623 start_codon:yes stop_codon:yes gene_type:complete